MFDSALYLTLAMYVESVFPGEFGTPLPWYFPFSVSAVVCVLFLPNSNVA